LRRHDEDILHQPVPTPVFRAASDQIGNIRSAAFDRRINKGGNQNELKRQWVGWFCSRETPAPTSQENLKRNMPADLATLERLVASKGTSKGN